MRLLFDFLPLLVFFIFYKLCDIYYASVSTIILSGVILFFTWLCIKKIEKISLIAFFLLAIFGSLTLYYHNAEFIKWKVTIVYTIFSLILLINHFTKKRLFIQQILGQEICLPDRIWNKLNIAWSLFFLVCGIINIFIAFYFPQDIWVNFKVFGLTGLMIMFSVLNGLYIYKNKKNVNNKNK